jgi:exonuclease III
MMLTQSSDISSGLIGGGELRFASWNVNGQNGFAVDSHVRYLQSKGCSVVALQEVKQDYFAALKRHPRIVAAAYSLAVRPPAAGTPARRLLGCAIVVLDASVEIGDAALIETSICPERTLVADATVGGHRVVVASLHCPNGSNWGNDKAVWFHEVANWLREQTVPTVFGIDANTPKNEGLDDRSYAKWWREDSHPAVGNGALKLVGNAPIHGLRDVWKQLNPGAAAFPVSHNRDNRSVKRPEYGCRYDFVFTSSHFTPIACEYYYDEVVKATPRLSDHALVSAIARLEPTATPYALSSTSDTTPRVAAKRINTSPPAKPSSSRRNGEEIMTNTRNEGDLRGQRAIFRPGKDDGT